MKTFKALGVILTISGMMALSACSGQPDPANGTNGTNGTLRIGVSSIPTTLDPAQNFSLSQTAIMGLVGGTLTNLAPDGKSVSMGLAESVTPGEKQYVVKLKPNLKFSDGSPLAASDVVASFEHYRTDKTSGLDYAYAPIEKVTAVDELTVNFDLKRPYPALEYAFAYGASAILPAKSIQARGQDLYKGDPLPTAGKYQVETFDQNQIVLQANPNYAGQQPSTKTLTFKQIADPAARLAQVQGGQLDYTDEISPQQVPQISAPVEAGTIRAANGQTFLGMNNRDNSVLSDVRIRKAVSTAIDRAQVNQVAFAGQNQPSLGLFANASKNMRPFLKDKADVAAAKAMLAGTKCADGCTLRFIAASDDGTNGDIALVVQQNLKAIGIDVTIEKAEKTVVSQYATEGNYDLRVTGSYEQTDDAGFYTSFTLGPVIKALRTGYANPEMSQLIETVQTTTGSTRESAVNQVNALFQKDLPMAPIADFMVLSASRVPAETFSLDPTYYYHIG